ncbi:MAG: YbaK/EbsC family protein [Rhodospirillales bacterium]|nr:YbaK/EbsC family protein [Rhodospirillales bacterium]
MNVFEHPSVKRVAEVLGAAGLADRLIALAETARTAEDAARAVGAPLGAIVKSLVFSIDRRMVMALVAGDHRCLPENLPAALFMKGEARQANASEVKAVTGFTIGGVAPVGALHALPMVMDRSLKRFPDLYAAAGHPHCVFRVTVDELKRLTGAIVSYNIAAPIAGKAADSGFAPSAPAHWPLGADGRRLPPRPRTPEPAAGSGGPRKKRRAVLPAGKRKRP